MCFRFNTLISLVHASFTSSFAFYKNCENFRWDGYLMSPTAATKTEPVAPFSLREIHAVFLRVNRSFASRHWGALRGNEMRRCRLLHVSPAQKNSLHQNSLPILPSLFASASIVLQINYSMRNLTFEVTSLIIRIPPREELLGSGSC